MKPVRRWTVAALLSAQIAAGCGLVLHTTPAESRQPPARAAQADPLLQQVDQAIDVTARRYLTAGVHTPWQIIHGTLGLRHDFIIRVGDEKVRAIDWLTNGAKHNGVDIFQVTEHGGRAHPFTVPYLFEGHPNQFLAYFTMLDLPADYQFKAGDQTITISDIVRNGQMEISEHDEPTWTLWGLSHYLEPDARWLNKHGESWSIERLVQHQTHDSVLTAACGGTHGLFALSHARNRYLATGRPLRGVWLEADQKIQRYIEAARSLQNPDGTFSARYFEGPQFAADFETRLGTSGHMLEWLVNALPQERLNEEWVRRGVAAIAKELIDNRTAPAECGALYHAVNALCIYRDRMRPKSNDEPVVQDWKSRPAGSAEPTKPAEAPKPSTPPEPADPNPVAQTEAVSEGTPAEPPAPPQPTPATSKRSESLRFSDLVGDLPLPDDSAP